jgi:glycosyltransferase involved in cell wall biosynthesis
MKVSVVIPCRNEKNYIKLCIDAIYASKLNHDIVLTVIVVDGMSDDGTQEVLSNLQLLYPMLVVVNNSQKLTPVAFNLGINYTDFDYLQIIGARHIISSNYIAKSLDVLKNKQDVWCVGGRIKHVFTNRKSQIISDVMSTPLGMGLGNFRTLHESTYTDTVTSPMYPKFVFDMIGLFDEQLVRNQDDDFNFRITKAGGKIWFENDIVLDYYVRSNFKGLSRQFYQYGYWKVFVNKKHKTFTTFRQLAPPIFVLYLLSLFFISFIPSYFKAIYLSGIIVYGFLLLFVSIKKAKELLATLQYIMTFKILHLSYGLGYLHGILNFILLNRKPSSKQMKLTR